MIRQRSIPATNQEQDRSMRVVEYAMAFVAIVVWGSVARGIGLVDSGGVSGQ